MTLLCIRTYVQIYTTFTLVNIHIQLQRCDFDIRILLIVKQLKTTNKLYKNMCILFQHANFTHFPLFFEWTKNVTERNIAAQSIQIENQTKPVFDEYGFMTKTEFKHHNYKELESFLKDINETYPNITELKSIGKSVKGKELYVMVLGSTPLLHVPGKQKKPTKVVAQKR